MMSFSNKIKVLHFLTAGEIGGQEKALFNLLKGFKENKDFTVGVAFARKIGKYAKEIEHLNIPIIELNLRSGFDLRYNKKLLDILREFQIHHLHDPSPNVTLISILCGSRIKRVITRRGGFHNYQKKGIKIYLKYKINKLMIKKYFDGFSGNTKLAANFVKMFYRIHNNPIFVLYNGFFFDALKPTIQKSQVFQELNISDNEFKIGTASHLNRCKRIDLIIRAFGLSRIREKKLLIFGKGPEEKELKKMAKKLNLEHSIYFLGEKYDLHNYLQALDCFILASGVEESFGNALVEAMHLKVPSIIMNDSIGLKEHIIDNRTGFIANDEVDLVKKIEFIFSNKDLAQKIAKKGYEYVSEKYTIQNMINSYIEFYECVLKQEFSDCYRVKDRQIV